MNKTNDQWDYFIEEIGPSLVIVGNRLKPNSVLDAVKEYVQTRF